MKKNLFFFLLLIAIKSSYAYDFSAVCSTGQTLYYNITSDSTVSVTSPQGSGWDGYIKPQGSLTIPEVVTHNNITYLVTSIDQYAFFECENLNGTLIIPNTVTYIDESAFYYCSNIDSLFIGQNLKNIGNRAFSGCTSITFLYYNAKNSTKGFSWSEHYYYSPNPYFPNLQHLIIGDSVQTIPIRAFYGYSNLDGTLIIPDNVTGIGSSAFEECRNLDSLVIGQNVTAIRSNAFKNCTQLGGKLVIPDNVTIIEPNAFFHCYNLNSLVIGQNVTTVDYDAFNECSNLDSVIIGPNVSFINSGAFRYCTGVTYMFYNARNCTTNFYNENYSSSNQSFPNLQHLIIGDSVQIIPDRAFYGCSNLDGTLIIPDNVTVIGTYSFRECSSLDSLIIGQNVNQIGDYAFYGCTQLDGKLVIPDNVTTIGFHAFYDCSHLDSIFIGQSVTYISSSFYGCQSVEYMFYNARNCTSQVTNFSNLRNLVIGDSVRSIPNSAFKGCGTHTLTIGQNVRSIGVDAFSSCPVTHLFYNARDCSSSLRESSWDQNSHVSNQLISNLQYLEIGDSVVHIPNLAFGDCSNLDTIIIGYSVGSFGNDINNAFYGCSNVTYLYYNARNCTSDFTVVPGSHGRESCIPNLQHLILGDSVRTIPSYAFYECSNINGALAIPDNVTYIGTHAFYGCSNLDTLIIGQNLSSINDCTFQECSQLDGTLVIPDNVTSIGISAFHGCSNIDSLIIGQSVTIIENNAFWGCSDLNGTLVIPNNVTNIGGHAFYNCSNLFHLVVGQNVTSIGNSAFAGCSQLGGTIIIPNKVTSIGVQAFNNCSNIDSLVIGKRVSTIGDRAFQGCTGVHYLFFNARNCINGFSYMENETRYQSFPNLQHFIIGDSVKTIPNYAFYTFSHLNGELVIPNGITTIGSGAFSNCTNSNNINIPNSVSSIGSNAFANCDNVINLNIDNASVTIGDSAFIGCDRLVNVNLGDSTISIGNSAFEDCFRLNNVQMGNSVIRIGNSAFEGCVRLPFPKLSETLTFIGDNAFKGCNLISGEITIPAEVDSIGDYAFSGCSGVTALNMKPLNPPIIYEHTFDSISINIPVYVPCGRVLNYYVTNYWENFPNILEAQPFEVEVSSNNNAMGTATVTSAPTCANHEAIIAATANEGFHFHSWNDGNQLNPRSVIIEQDTSFTAIFAFNQINVELLSADPSMGTVSGSGIYGYNNVVTATAIPNNNYHFLRWSDGNTQNPRYFAATEDITLTAIFASNISNITVTSSNSDMGTAIGSGLYYYQQQISIMANPNYGYHFVAWNDGNTQNPRQLIVNCDTSFVATFAPNIYAVSINSLNNVMGYTSGSGNYVYNSPISFSATANYGYHFTQWNDGSTINPRTLTVTQDTSFTAQFAANSYAVAVTANDPTMGSAYGAGTFTYNTQTVISAAANYGYHFVQWSDGVTENPRMITVTNSAEYEAQFAINFYTITVGSNNPAIGTASGGGTYNYNSVINLVATPNYGYHFTQWSDGNTDNPRVITVIQNASYTAQFAINSYTVSVSGNDPARGSVSGAGSYIYNNTATISASPNYGYHFTQWNDGNTDNPRTFVVTQDVSYTAQFDYNTYTISTYSNDITIGYVTGGGTYNYNSIVALTAVPSEHYHFVQWSDSISDNPRNIIVKKDSVYTAYFAIDQHLIQVNSENTVMGSVSGTGFYNYGSGVYITAMPNYGYHFTQWSDGNTQNPRHLTVNGNMEYTAQFALNSYTATILCNDTVMGHVSSSGIYNYMSHLSLLATPNYGYHFVEWNDGNTDNPRNITLTQDTIFSAQFAPNMYHVSLVANNSNFGSVSGAGDYPYLTTVAISANAYEHYHFTQWSDGNTQNPRQINVRCDTSFTALFEINNYTATIMSNDTTMGSVNGGGTYNYLTALTLTATPVYGYHFVQWSDGNTDNPRSLTLTNDTVLTAQFAINIYHVTLSVNDSTLGTTSGSGDYEYLSQVLISAIANANCHFVQWSDGSTSNPRQITLTTDLELTAQFSENEKFIIQVVSSDNTMGTVSGGGEYYVGTQIEIEAIPYEHYRFTQWSDGVTDNPRLVTVLENVTYTALFEPETYEITVFSSNEIMGTATGGGTYAYGSTVELRATANNGYHFVCWNDGDSNSVRTIVVEGDAEYIATFSEGVSIANHLTEKISVYPNPTYGQVYVSTEDVIKIEVYDMYGKLLKSKNSDNNTDLSDLADGVYVLRVYTSVGVCEKKVVKGR